MTITTPASAADIVWDLGALYTGGDDPNLAADRREVEGRVASFEVHRGTIAGLDPSGLRALIEEFEALDCIADRIGSFGLLWSCTHEDDGARVALRDEIDEQGARWRARLLFFDLELKQLGEDRLRELAAAPELAPWAHWLDRKRTMAKLALSEPEEQVVVKKNIAGRDAVVRFREELASKFDFGEFEVDGGRIRPTESELRAFGEHGDPDVRFRSQERVLTTYRRHEDVLSFLYRSVVKDAVLDAEMRGATHPIELENVPNEIPGGVVTALVEATRSNLPLLHDYWAWKGRRLGLDRMRTCDRLAQPSQGEPQRMSWTQACELVDRAFAGFDEGLAGLAKETIATRRIDAAVRTGKRGGGFCMPVAQRDCWVLVNYTDSIDSAFTLAHELGHAAHFMLAAREQRPLVAHASSKVLAETASEFAECLLIDHLEQTSDDDELLAHVLAHACQGFVGVVYRQVMFTEFELAAHERSMGGPLQSDFMQERWSELSRDYYGPHVELAADENVGYATVPHFVFAPFYCYSYALSQVAVLALYERYLQDRAVFAPLYRELLAAGGSAPAGTTLARAGVDLEDPATMQRAFDLFASRFERLRKITGD